MPSTSYLLLPLSRLLTTNEAPLMHGTNKELSPLLIGEDVQGPGFHSFFLVSRFGVVAPTDAGAGMDLGAGETIDWNGGCSFGHLGYEFRLHPVSLFSLTNPKPPSRAL